jgi:hypothetical protein
MTQGKPCSFLPIPKSKRASRIFLVKERGFVPAMIASRDPGSDGGTSAGDILSIGFPKIKFHATNFALLFLIHPFLSIHGT